MARAHQILSEPILRGRLQELDVGSLLSALRLGRQYLTLEVYDAVGDCTGVVAIKAGRIISASVDGYTGTEAVRRLLQSRNAAEFRVLLQPSTAGAEAESLGTIASITQAISESEVRTLIGRKRLLEGVLSEQLSFDDVLRGLAFTRQHIALALSDAAGNELGEVSVKANKVLAARAGDQLALPALQELRRAPVGTSFVLFAESQSVEQLHPLGTVGEVLGRITDSSPDAPAPSTNGVAKRTSPAMQASMQGGQTPARLGRILEGSLDEFEISHVLKVLSTSRQPFELHVRDEAAATVGMIEVKSGMVVAATTDTLTGVPAAHELLRVQKGRFVAIRRAERTIEQPALLSVSELLQPKAAALALHPAQATPEDTSALSQSRAVELKAPDNAPDNAGSAPIPVMDAKLGELDVASILHVAGASRQYTCVHIFDDQRTPLGVIHLKSGQVVRAQAQDVTGIIAVRRLLHCPRDFSFLVERYPHATEATSSIGSVASVLSAAAAQPAPASAPATGETSFMQPPERPKPREASSTTWIGGAVLGAGFVLLGGIATALVLRPPALTTSISPISAAPEKLGSERAEITQRPTLQREQAAVEPANRPTQSDTSINDAPRAAVPSDSSATVSRATIASLQAGLHQLGYETGVIDGVVGPRTAAAIKAFQYAEHLTVDGTLSAPTRAVLLRRISEP